MNSVYRSPRRSVFVPIAVIVVFWLVHILPEKIAEKRHHPQKQPAYTRPAQAEPKKP